jgi:hypothetical protein
MPRRVVMTALALTASASILAGCGGSSGGSTGSTNTSGSPQAELTNAITALGSASTIDATLKLNATGSQLRSFALQQDPTAKITPAQANALAGAQLEFEVTAPSGKTLNDLSSSNGSGAAQFVVSDQGSPLVTIRGLNKTLYFQVALKDLLDRLGKSTTYAQIQSSAGQLPPFVQDLLNGKWVSLQESTLKSLTSQLGGTQSGANRSQASAVLNALKSLLTKDVTVTRTSSGSTDVLTVSGNARTLAGDFESAIESNVPAAGAALGSTNLSNVPNKTLTLTAAVTGGALSGLTIDLAQFSKSGHGSLPLHLAVAQTGPAITAPSGATPVDISQIGQLLGQFGALGGQ